MPFFSAWGARALRRKFSVKPWVLPRGFSISPSSTARTLTSSTISERRWRRERPASSSRQSRGRPWRPCLFSGTFFGKRCGTRERRRRDAVSSPSPIPGLPLWTWRKNIVSAPSFSTTPKSGVVSPPCPFSAFFRRPSGERTFGGFSTQGNRPWMPAAAGKGKTRPFSWAVSSAALPSPGKTRRHLSCPPRSPPSAPGWNSSSLKARERKAGGSCPSRANPWAPRTPTGGTVFSSPYASSGRAPTVRR